MVKRVTSVLAICLATALMMGSAKMQSLDQSITEEIGDSSAENIVDIDEPLRQVRGTIIANPRVIVASAEENEEPETEISDQEPETEISDQEPEVTMSEEDIELIALVTMAEAEGECEDGKRLVIDTILNRVDSDSPYFPDTVKEVVYQKNQFTSMTNGRVDRCYVKDDICQLVLEELECRTNYEVMYFTAGKYGEYGTPMFQVGNHYFSSN